MHDQSLPTKAPHMDLYKCTHTHIHGGRTHTHTAQHIHTTHTQSIGVYLSGVGEVRVVCEVLSGLDVIQEGLLPDLGILVVFIIDMIVHSE